MYEGRKVYAIVLAAGSGRRMHSKQKKQFMEILGKPLYTWSAEQFDSHPAVDGIIITTAEEDIPYMETLTEFRKSGASDIYSTCDTAKTYPLQKLSAIIPGGKERYNSVFNGLNEIRKTEHISDTSSDSDVAISGDADPIVMIHDCARPMITHAIIDDALHYAAKYHAAVIGMPVKDTIKIIDEEHFVKSTPERSSVWLMETPQSFDFSLIYSAYKKLIQKESEGRLMIPVTDDAMVVETFTGARVKVVAGTYENIKITTPEDIKIAETYLSK
ncbi:2-C-methyl-D-erythritol 4-phosphate cytidylyltransferase [Lachnospiraceae bacterium JC7]|nr:2-C-methyl-D-erythritol 4-phosphate cytidylyltransferase [Lachnospiraceae bacterium JC7]